MTLSCGIKNGRKLKLRLLEMLFLVMPWCYERMLSGGGGDLPKVLSGGGDLPKVCDHCQRSSPFPCLCCAAALRLRVCVVLARSLASVSDVSLRFLKKLPLPPPWTKTSDNHTRQHAGSSREDPEELSITGTLPAGDTRSRTAPALHLPGSCGVMVGGGSLEADPAAKRTSNGSSPVLSISDSISSVMVVVVALKGK